MFINETGILGQIFMWSSINVTGSVMLSMLGLILLIFVMFLVFRIPIGVVLIFRR